MESWSLQSPGVTALPSSRNGLVDKPFIFGQTLKLPNLKEHPCARNIKLLNSRAKASGLAKSSSGKTEVFLNKADLNEGDLVFVAGATGRVGSRTVRELLKLGFRVRAGVRSANRAEALIQSVKQMKLENAEGLQQKLEIVECDLEKPDQIVQAIGKSSVVICCIGASEKEVFDVTGPCRIDFRATKNLVDAAKSAKVNHFILVSSLGTNKFGFPAAILNLFWGVLIWKRKAEEALIASGIPYTIVRPGGMERPTDAYKETHNITLSVEDTLFGGQVSNLQVAELMAVMAKNPDLSYCKIVEVIAETTAPLTPMEELLAKIPSQRVKPEVAVAVEDSTTSTSNVLVAEPPTTPSEKENAMRDVTSRRPLSPYTAYDDLKPPTSPTPTSPSSQKGNKDTIEATLKTKATESEGTVVGSEPGIDIAKTIQEAVPKAQPLSPNTAYDDLKPPTSPSPTSPSSQKGNKDAAVAVAEINVADSQANIVVPETGSEAADKGKESDAAMAAEISALDSQTRVVVPETGVEATQSNQVVLKPRPLSPYTAYSDLKPPTSPSPTSPSNHKGNKDAAVAVADISAADGQATIVVPETSSEAADKGNEGGAVTAAGISALDGQTSVLVPETGTGAAEADEKVFEKEKPLSPYTTSDGMKPPAPPSPSFSGPGEIPSVVSTNKTMESPTGNNDASSPEALKTVEIYATKDSSFYRSPYFVYDDFKPPTSPSPSQPNASSSPVSSGTSDNGAAKPSTMITPNPEAVHQKRKLKPLSPYTMYEDLKPPTSPTPFPNNF